MDCAVLGVYPQPLIRELFSESYLNGYFTAGKPSNLDWLQLDVTNRAVQIECPEYTGPKPSPTLIKQAHKYVVKFNQNVSPVFPLEPALQKALGGSSYLTSGLLTEFGHYIGTLMLFYEPHLSNNNIMKPIFTPKIIWSCSGLVVFP